MLKFLIKYSVKRKYKKLNKLLDKQSGKPKTSNDWKVKSITCETILNDKKTTDEIAITALKMIKEESEVMAELIQAKNLADYLSDFVQEKGIDKYIQISGRKFANEYWFYKDKSKITLINENNKADYLVSSFNPGRCYENKDGETTNSIILNNNSPKQILMKVDTEDDYESFVLELEKVPNR